MERLVLFDDLDNDMPADESIPFALDDVIYRLDLTTANAATFRLMLEPYLKVAKKIGKQKIARGMPRAAGHQSPASKPPAKPKVVPKPAETTTNGAKVPARAGKPEDDPAYRQQARAWLLMKHGKKLPPRLSQAMLNEYAEHLAATGADS